MTQQIFTANRVKLTSKVLSPTLYPLSSLNARKPASGSAYSQKPKAKEMTYIKISQGVNIMLRTQPSYLKFSTNLLDFWQGKEHYLKLFLKIPR